MNSLRAKVKELFKNNHRIGNLNRVHFDYTCPSPKNYPHQWLWDSCFHAIVLTNFDKSRAKNEIRTLLLNQRRDGFVPCVSIWKRRFPFEESFYVNKITQPPVIPLAVEIIYETTRDISFVKEVYPKLKSHMEWLFVNRDRNKNNLIEIIHPWEDGDDGNPSFDTQMGFENQKPSTLRYFFSLFRQLWFVGKKPFSSETILFNSIYAKSLLSMANLAKTIGNPKDVDDFMGRYQKTKKALIDLCWNKKDKIFYDLDGNSRQSGVKTVSSLMAIILPDLPRKVAQNLIEKHLLNKEEFWLPYPISSVAKDEKTFNPGKSFSLWRGPTWINTSWFLVEALKNYGYSKEASYLALKTKQMVEKHGFWEFYNPFTGAGYGQANYGWSALVLMM